MTQDDEERGELIALLGQSVIPHVTQALGFIENNAFTQREGLMIVYKGKQYLLHVTTREEFEIDMLPYQKKGYTFYELGGKKDAE